MKRMHIHVGVKDLAESISFYTTLFDAKPSVEQPDYAKWMLEDPRINFAISSGHCEGTGIEHLGIQVDSDEELQEIRQRLTAANDVPVMEEDQTSCCYARSDKTWTTDPQDVVWETFHSMEQIETYGRRPELDKIDAAMQNCCK